jgi:D-alanine-D-alanine ligase-like ATP-grasp enzyme
MASNRSTGRTRSAPSEAQGSSRPARERPSRALGGDGLFYVLLHDTEHLARQRERAIEESSVSDADLEDTRRINDGIRGAITDHPLLANATLCFFEDPYAFMQQVMRDYPRLTAVFNFCDDFADRTSLRAMPALFELLDVPFSGHSTRSLQLTHNELYSRSVAKQLGIAVPRTHHGTRSTLASLSVDRFPALVKPVNQRGSEGNTTRSVVHDGAQLQAVAAEMTRAFGEIIVTDLPPGDEYSVCILRQEDHFLPLGIRHLAGAFDGDPAVKEQLIRDSVRLCHALGCREYARVAWTCDPSGTPRFIELDENPSFRRGSHFAWALNQASLNRQHLYQTLVGNLLRDIDYRMVPIGDFLVREDVLDLRWRCEAGCAAICCADGCWFVREDRDRVEVHLPAIFEYLRDRPELPFWSGEGFCDAVPWHKWTLGQGLCEDWYNTGSSNGLCGLQQPDGRCAVHSWCLDNEVPWETFKFAACSAWPLAFEQHDGVWELRLHREFYDREWDTCPCLRRGEHAAAVAPEAPLLVESLGTTISSRLGQERHAELLAVARQRHQPPLGARQARVAVGPSRPGQRRARTRRAR